MSSFHGLAKSFQGIKPRKTTTENSNLDPSLRVETRVNIFKEFYSSCQVQFGCAL